MPQATKEENALKKEIAISVNSPLRFVTYSYPWGREGTPLEHETGPDVWQYQVLKDIGHAIKNGWVMNNGVRKECENGRIWIAVRSGHGVGKTTLMAWLDQWFGSTHPNPQCITTANTETQLSNKTWREMAKWHKMMINKHWFEWTATKFICKASPSTWYSQAIPWSATNPQAFAGTHEKYIMVKFDEASEIDDAIWDVTEGAMTDCNGLKIWIVFGNPTQNTGRFSECFGKFRNRWITYEVDARASNRTDKKLIQEQIDTYGIDSDFVRVRILGKEPRGGSTQFLPSELVERAKGKHISPNMYLHSPKILGVDIAREGDDRTVLITRRGLAAYGLKKYNGLNTLQCAGIIAEAIKKGSIDAVFLDMGNVGAAIYDILQGWNFKQVVGVWFAAEADSKQIYRNKRAEMVARVKDWLEEGGCFPDDNEMRDDMVTPQRIFTLSKDLIQLESSKDIKGRGKPSPDCLMALALTFAYAVDIVKKKMEDERSQAGPRTSTSAPSNYDMLTYSERSNVDNSRIIQRYSDYHAAQNIR